jgi:hypothetical protein
MFRAQHPEDSPMISLLLAIAIAPAHAESCPAPMLYTTDGAVTLVSTTAGDTIPFGGLTLRGVEPDEIDLRSECTPTIAVEGLELHGVEPDEIDLAADGSLDIGALSGEAHTRGDIVLKRGIVGASFTLAPVSALLREEEGAATGRAVLVLDVVFELVDVQADDGRTQAMVVVPAATTITQAADALYPELPICAHCAAD